MVLVTLMLARRVGLQLVFGNMLHTTSKRWRSSQAKRFTPRPGQEKRTRGALFPFPIIPVGSEGHGHTERPAVGGGAKRVFARAIADMDGRTAAKVIGSRDTPTGLVDRGNV